MHDSLLWSVILLAIGFVLLVAELFIPSAGMMTVCCIVSLVAAVAVAFTHSVTWGITSLIIVFTVAPVTLAFLIRLWPYTPIGRRILLRSPDAPLPDVLPNDSHRKALQALVGCIGRSVSDMMPNGMIEIDGQRFDAISVSGLINSGQAIEVVSCTAGKLHVRSTKRSPESNSNKSGASASGDPATASTNDTQASPLQRPLEELGLSDLEDPLTP